MANTSPLFSRPREKQLNIRLGSAEKSSARLAANGLIIKKIKKGVDNSTPLCYNKYRKREKRKR